MKVVAILLAAGESSRMGRPKPLLEWFGKTLVDAQIDALLDGGADEVFVVTGKSDARVAPLLSNRAHVHRVHNPDFAEGKTTSVKAGVTALPLDTAVIVLLAVDQPRPAWVVRRVIESHLASGASVTSPRFDGHGGHPLLFAGALREELLAISESAEGIREVVRRYSAEMNRVEFDSAIIRLDLNTPEAYEKALRDYPKISEYPGG